MDYMPYIIQFNFAKYSKQPRRFHVDFTNDIKTATKITCRGDFFLTVTKIIKDIQRLYKGLFA